MKEKNSKNLPFPGWLFLVVMSVYVETLLYIWTADRFVAGRFGTILLFGLAFGSCLGLITSFLPPKAEKWTAVVLSSLLAVLCMVEYFLHDAFQYFMPLISIFTTAGDVAEGYSGTIISLVLKNLWRIGLILLPVVLYAIFSVGTKPQWKRSVALLAAAAALYADRKSVV